jgi:ribosomal protein S18 acetylase RimI-like enzyme
MIQVYNEGPVQPGLRYLCSLLSENKALWEWKKRRSMDSKIVYRAMQEGEEKLVARLIESVFHKFIAHTYTAEGVEEFEKAIDPKNLFDRSRKGHRFLVAVKDGEVVGVIALRDKSHITFLFVAEKYHRKGIAKELFRRSLQICRRNYPDIEECTVNSSTYALPFYEKLGFRKAGPEHYRKGMRITPMVLMLSTSKKVKNGF